MLCIRFGGEVNLAELPVSREDFLPRAGFGFGEVEGGAVQEFGAEIVVEPVGSGAAGVGIDGGVWDGGIQGVSDGVAVVGRVADYERGNEGVHCGERCRWETFLRGECCTKHWSTHVQMHMIQHYLTQSSSTVTTCGYHLVSCLQEYG